MGCPAGSSPTHAACTSAPNPSPAASSRRRMGGCQRIAWFMRHIHPGMSGALGGAAPSTGAIDLHHRPATAYRGWVHGHACGHASSHTYAIMHPPTPPRLSWRRLLCDTPPHPGAVCQFHRGRAVTANGEKRIARSGSGLHLEHDLKPLTDTRLTSAGRDAFWWALALAPWWLQRVYDA